MQKFLSAALLLLVGFCMGWWLPNWSAAPGGGAPERRNAGSLSAAPIGLSDRGYNSTSKTKTYTHLPQEEIEQQLKAAFKPGGVSYAALKPLMMALASMGSDNVSQFTRFFDEESMRKPQVFLWRLFFSAWGEFDPDGAIAYIDGRFEQAGARRLFYGAVMDTWKDSSIDAMLEFAAEKYLAGKEAAGAGLALDYLRSMSKSDPAASAEMAKRLGDGEFVLELMSRRIAELVKEDREAALVAIEGLEGEAHTHAAGQFMIEWAKGDAPGAAAWLVDHYSPDMTTGVIAGVAAELVRSDPDAAMRWVASLPDGVPRADVVAGAFGNWAQADSTAALGWLRGASSEAVYDGAVVTAGNLLMSTAPQEVLEHWVPKVSDPAIANALLYETSLAWQRDNLRDYSRWLESTEAIPAATKQRLRDRELPGEGDAEQRPVTAPPIPGEQGRFDSD